MPQNSGQSSVNPELSILTIDGPSYSLGSDGEYLHLTSGGLEKQHYVKGITEAVLTKLGYEKSRINAIQKANYRFEKKLAEKDVLLAKVSVEGQQRSRADTIEAAGDYPLEKILDAWNVPEEGVCFYNKGKMDGIISLCSEQNLEDIKSMLIVHTVLKGARYLDRETEELNSELQKSRLSEEPEDTVHDVRSGIATLEQLNNFHVDLELRRCGKCQNNCLLTINTFSTGDEKRTFITGNRCEKGAELEGNVIDASNKKNTGLDDDDSGPLPNLFEWKYKRLFNYIISFTPIQICCNISQGIIINIKICCFSCNIYKYITTYNNIYSTVICKVFTTKHIIINTIISYQVIMLR